MLRTITITALAAFLTVSGCSYDQIAHSNIGIYGDSPTALSICNGDKTYYKSDRRTACQALIDNQGGQKAISRGQSREYVAIAHLNMARMTEGQEAIGHYSKALINNPSLINAYKERAALWIELEIWDEAVKDLSVWLRANPADGAHTNLRAIAYHKLGLCDEALLDADRAIKLGWSKGILIKILEDPTCA